MKGIFTLNTPNNSLKLKQENDTLTPAAVYSRSQRLKNIFDCNRLTAKLINACLTGRLEETRATRIVYMIGVLMKGIEIGELEKRIEALENTLATQKYEQN